MCFGQSGRHPQFLFILSPLSSPALAKMLLLPFTLIFSLRYALLVQAGSQKHGQNCTLTHNRLQTGTFAFYSDCDSKTYCNSSQLCDLKQCRKDLYPFGYDKDDTHLPTLCGPGRFCPDEGGASCMDQLPVGSPCQLNRDGERSGYWHESASQLTWACS